MKPSAKGNSWVRKVAVIGIVASALVPTNNANADSSPKAATGEWYAYMPLAHTWYPKTPTNASSPTASPSPGSAGRLLDPITIGACDIGLHGTLVASFLSKYDGRVSLKCGSTDVGYIHIRTKHQSQWDAFAAGNGYWDDFMLWSAESIVLHPESSHLDSDMKRCYTAPVKTYFKKDGINHLLKSFSPTVIVSTNNRVMITAYPSKTSRCR